MHTIGKGTLKMSAQTFPNNGSMSTALEKNTKGAATMSAQNKMVRCEWFIFRLLRHPSDVSRGPHYFAPPFGFTDSQALRNLSIATLKPSSA